MIRTWCLDETTLNLVQRPKLFVELEVPMIGATIP